MSEPNAKSLKNQYNRCFWFSPRQYFGARKVFYKQLLFWRVSDWHECVKSPARLPWLAIASRTRITRPSAASCPICSTAVLGLEDENRWVRLRVTNAALRTIDKNGIEAVWRTFAPAAKSNRSSPWRKVFVKKSNWLLPPVQVTSTQPLRTNAILVARWKCPSTIRLPQARDLQRNQTEVIRQGFRKPRRKSRFFIA